MVERGENVGRARAMPDEIEWTDEDEAAAKRA
jgi:hypothetical protein